MKELLRVLRDSLPEFIGGLILAGVLSILGAVYIGFSVIGATLIAAVLVAAVIVLVIVVVKIAPKDAEAPSWKVRGIRDLDERQAAFEELEAIYLQNPRAVKTLTIRKETSSSFLAIPEDGTNVFIDHDRPERRMETALRRKTVYRRLIEQGARIRVILSVNPSGILERGYSRESAIARLLALRSFLEQYLENDNFEAVRRSPGVEYRRFSIYNTDVLIESTALRLPHQRGDRSSVVLDPRDIAHEIKLFDERLEAYRDLNLKAAKRAGISSRQTTRRRRGKMRKKSKSRIVKEYLLSEIDKELSTLQKVRIIA